MGHQGQEVPQSQHEVRIKLVLTYILHHFKENLQLDHLASIACLSPYHFHRLFKAYTGEGVHAYIKRLRLEYAALCLLKTDEPASSIALSSGYSNISAFSKAFRQYYGVSPQDFRIIDNGYFKMNLKVPKGRNEWVEA